MKRFLTIICALALLACIPSVALAADLGITRYHFLGKFIEGAVSIQSGHLITDDNYFQDPEDSNSHYFRVAPSVVVYLQSEAKTDKLYNVTALHVTPATTQSAKDFITCIAEIAYANGAIPSLSAADQFAFMQKIGMAGSSYKNGDTGSARINGVIYEWLVDYSYGGILLFVDPAY